MTTIAYKDGMLAADTMLSDGECGIVGHAPKIFKTFKGDAVFAGCGSYDDVLLVYDWLLFEGWKNRDKNPSVEGFQGILYKDETVYMIDDKLIPYEVDAKFLAIGSGAAYAIGAMAMGATANIAVGVACDWDSLSGVKCCVDFVELDIKE